MGKFVCILGVIFLTVVYQTTADITAVDCTVGHAENGDKTCQAEDSNAVCPGTDGATSKCDCKADYFFNSDKTQCVQSIEEITCTPGDGTDGNTKCETEDDNAECPAGTTKCACTSEYFLGSDKKTCVKKITTVGCTPDDNTEGTTKCQKVDANSECPADGDKCACKDGYSGTNSCIKDAGSSATSVKMTTSLFVTYMLIYLSILFWG